MNYPRRNHTFGKRAPDSSALRSVFALCFVLGSALAISSCADEEQTPPAAPQKIVAFPGAEGFGKNTAGGRGGDIIFVTTLADKGVGSLRACIEAEGPRICVFRVGGVIRFTSERPLIQNPYITIAGQTAPGGGILLTHDGGDVGLTPIAIKNTHDVIIRHVRVRTDKMGANRGSNDAFTIENSTNVILDHVSGSWALDENFNGHLDNDAITVSWSIFAEGIPRHDKCALLNSDATKPQKFSFLKNICAHNGDRNPDANFPPGSCVEMINNVLYNATGEYAEIWESYGGTPINIVGNYFKAGPDTPPGAAAITRMRIGSTGVARIYSAENYIDPALKTETENVHEIYSDTPVCPLSIEPLKSHVAYEKVLRGAGAFPRDAVDKRIVNEVRHRSGHLVKKPGALPEIANGAMADDVDKDGMSDSWERIHGVNDLIFNPWEDADGDGWSNMDEFLDSAHRKAMAENDQ